MRINEPVTNVEHTLKDDVILVSKTNLRGITSYANKPFIEISGFKEDELIGKNHNVVRHPDMPPEAFEDLWGSVKAGKPWLGIVKNRCKNGDYYWVQANVSPVFKNGQVVEYLSVRSKPSASEIEQATKLYQKIQEGKASIHQRGAISKITGFWRRLSLKLRMGIMLSLVAIAIWLVTLSTAGGELNVITMVEDGFITLLLFTLYIWSLKAIFNPLKEVQSSFRRMGEGNYSDQFDIRRQDEIGELLQELKTMQNNQRANLAYEREKMEETLRLKQALDSVSSNVMVADADHNVIYMNDTVKEMFRNAQKEIQADIPDFNVDTMMNANIDIYHKNPAYQREMLSKLTSSHESQLTIGGRYFRFIANPVVGDTGDRIGTVVEWADITDQLAREEEERQRAEQDRIMAEENGRIKQALDNVNSNVMVADSDLNIIYMNDAVKSMFKTNEADIRKDLPNFNASDLMGSCIDKFHKNPMHQRNLLGNLSSTYSSTIIVGGCTFDVVASPVINVEGVHVGTVVEWKDRTAEVAVEKEVEEIVNAALSGNLEKRINTNDKAGFFLQLSDGINQMVETVENSFNDVARVMRAMAAGDLTQKITADYDGTYADVKEDINSTIDKFEEVIGRIIESSEFFKNTSEEISAGNNNLSQRAEEQASTLEETASSMEQLTGTVKNNADNAQQANQLASNARGMAEKGGEVVQEAIGAMEEINSSSNKISEIIGVIDEIAFQTNLLALNASVEAARAGEQGRGFAVVATEVRNLAGRSATAAKEIKDLIMDSSEKVKNGSQLVNESGETLGEIVGSVKKVGDIISEIAAASQEQSAGIDQINKAVAQMDEMTQQNAALAEEASAASESSVARAVSLVELVEFFNTSGRAMHTESRSDSPHVTQPRKNKSQAVSQAVNHTKRAAKKTSMDDDEWEEF